MLHFLEHPAPRVLGKCTFSQLGRQEVRRRPWACYLSYFLWAAQLCRQGFFLQQPSSIQSPDSQVLIGGCRLSGGFLIPEEQQGLISICITELSSANGRLWIHYLPVCGSSSSIRLTLVVVWESFLGGLAYTALSSKLSTGFVNSHTSDLNLFMFKTPRVVSVLQ